MPWVAQDDHYFHNPKARAVGPLGRELFSASWCYCSIQLNDGLFIAEDVPVIAALAQVQPSVADRLCHEGLWHTEGTDCAKCRAVGQTMPVPAGHIAVHEYLKQNKTREKVLADRGKDAERQRKYRASQRDSQGTNDVSPEGPVPSPGSDLLSSRPGNSRNGSAPTDDGTDLSTAVPDEVWTHFADLKLEAELRAKDIPQSRRTKWKSTTRRNAKTEHGGNAERWWREYQLTPQHLAQCLVDGKPPAAHYRRKDPA